MHFKKFRSFFKYIENQEIFQDRTYPLYHTLHDTTFFVKTFVDPTFVYHQAVARIWGEFARLLVDSPVIPFNVEDYSKDLEEHYHEFYKLLSATPNAFAVNLGIF